MVLLAGLLTAAPDLSFDPSQSSLPGQAAIQQLINGLGFWALIAALAGMLIGALLWAVGHHASNYQQAYSGRKGVMVSGAAALVIGAAPTLIRYFFGLGQSVK
jgi:MFS family permease